MLLLDFYYLYCRRITMSSAGSPLDSFEHHSHMIAALFYVLAAISTYPKASCLHEATD